MQLKYFKKCERYYLIHGPPGTGKTVVICEIVRQLVLKQKKRVLILGPSHNAVDNILLKLIKFQDNLAETIKNIKSLLYINKQTGNLSQVQMIQDQIQQLEESDVNMEIVRLGNPALANQNLYNYHIWNKVQKSGNSQIKFEKAMNKCQVVASTIDYLYVSKNFKEYMEKVDLFDYIIIDEAGQALNFPSLGVLMYSQRCIFAGDHCQLPPTIINQNNQIGYNTLFEDLVELHEEENSNEFYQILRVQYRMNKNIMELVNEHIYQNLLLADQDIQDQKLKSKKGVPLQPVWFVDTTDSYYGENEKKLLKNGLLETSLYNLGEAEIVAFFYIFLQIKFDVKSEQIGVITPYLKQSFKIQERLRQLLQKNVINSLPEVATIDSFQGREKEVVIISCVRSNKSNKLGFLTDERRFNVALTRAKKLLVVIGNSQTLYEDEFLKSIVENIQQKSKDQKIAKYLKPENLSLKDCDIYKFEYKKFELSGVFQRDKNDINTIQSDKIEEEQEEELYQNMLNENQYVDEEIYIQEEQQMIKQQEIKEEKEQKAVYGQVSFEVKQQYTKIKFEPKQKEKQKSREKRQIQNNFGGRGRFKKKKNPKWEYEDDDQEKNQQNQQKNKVQKNKLQRKKSYQKKQRGKRNKKQFQTQSQNFQDEQQSIYQKSFQDQNSFQNDDESFSQSKASNYESSFKQEIQVINMKSFVNDTDDEDQINQTFQDKQQNCSKISQQQHKQKISQSYILEDSKQIQKDFNELKLKDESTKQNTQDKTIFDTNPDFINQQKTRVDIKSKCEKSFVQVLKNIVHNNQQEELQQTSQDSIETQNYQSSHYTKSQSNYVRNGTTHQDKSDSDKEKKFEKEIDAGMAKLMRKKINNFVLQFPNKKEYQQKLKIVQQKCEHFNLQYQCNIKKLKITLTPGEESDESSQLNQIKIIIQISKVEEISFDTFSLPVWRHQIYGVKI